MPTHEQQTTSFESRMAAAADHVDAVRDTVNTSYDADVDQLLDDLQADLEATRQELRASRQMDDQDWAVARASFDATTRKLADGLERARARARSVRDRIAAEIG
jgi:hypothetical protein